MTQKLKENLKADAAAEKALVVGDASADSSSASDGRGRQAALEERLGIELSGTSAMLEGATAKGRISWALERFKGRIVLTSSFGAQSAVLLHMATSEWPEIPVVLVDTGYLFPETYQFIEELTERLSLNLHVYRSEKSPAWQEAIHGKLWEEGVEGIERYSQLNKVEPMNRAFDELRVDTWITGLRREQSSTRKNLSVLAAANGRLKVQPIIDWTDRDVFDYLKKHDLPYHPLWEEGYVSIGDRHTSRKLADGMTAEETRFFGLKRECGLHEDADYVI